MAGPAILTTSVTVGCPCGYVYTSQNREIKFICKCTRQYHFTLDPGDHLLTIHIDADEDDPDKIRLTDGAFLDRRIAPIGEALEWIQDLIQIKTGATL